MKPQSKNICAGKEVSQMNSFVQMRIEEDRIAWNSFVLKQYIVSQEF